MDNKVITHGILNEEIIVKFINFTLKIKVFLERSVKKPTEKN